MWQSSCWQDCSPEDWPSRVRMNRDIWSSAWEIYSAEPTRVKNPPVDLKFPRGLCPIGVSRRTKGPRPPGWAGAPGTSAPRRVQAQPNRVELYREVFAFKSWKSHHCPSLASKKHNLVVGVGGSSGFTRWTHYLFFLSFRSIPLSKFCLRIQPSWWKSVQLSSASCDFSV